MPVCEICNKEFPNRIKVNDEWKVVNKRKYCIECSPFGLHNTKKLSGVSRADQREYKCKCGETNPEKFYGNKRTVCGKCHSKYTVDKRRALKRRAVDYKGGKCSICGYNKCFASLDFHHTNPEEKEAQFKTMMSWTWNRVLVELDKCILVCRNCHSELHYDYNNE
jgi:hypothetical protein